MLRSRAEPWPALTRAQPRLTHTFEFRLTGSETQEQCVPVGSGLSPAELLLATQGVRSTLRAPRIRRQPSARSARWKWRRSCAGGIVCRASLSEFGPRDLVVVQVDVALFARGV